MAGNSLSAGLSDMSRIKNCAAAVFNLGMSLFLLFWIRKNGLMERYGLCKAKWPANRFLWYIPLVILVSGNLCNGVEVTFPIPDVMFSVCNMIGVGFLEELLFRGFLFRAVSRNSAKRGIIISGVSFGLMHIVNLINGRGMGLAENMLQIIFAATFGVMCVMIFYKGKSLWPCILTHAAFDVAGIFSKAVRVTDPVPTLQNAAALLLMAGYTWILTKIPPEEEA